MKSLSYTISVYQEIKEISTLLPILHNHKQNIDEIVIVQTFKNEEDKTSELFNSIKNICQKYGDIYQVFHFQNSFSKLKNYLIELATKDYIINIDADELISTETMNLWLKIIQSQNHDLY
jgi:predicted patatin/cPLA2 family phospholipase